MNSMSTQGWILGKGPKNSSSASSHSPEEPATNRIITNSENVHLLPFCYTQTLPPGSSNLTFPNGRASPRNVEGRKLQPRVTPTGGEKYFWTTDLRIRTEVPGQPHASCEEGGWRGGRFCQPLLPLTHFHQ